MCNINFSYGCKKRANEVLKMFRYHGLKASAEKSSMYYNVIIECNVEDSIKVKSLEKGFIYAYEKYQEDSTID